MSAKGDGDAAGGKCACKYCSDEGEMTCVIAGGSDAGGCSCRGNAVISEGSDVREYVLVKVTGVIEEGVGAVCAIAC